MNLLHLIGGQSVHSCTHITFNVSGVLENLFFGVDSSGCPLPCEMFSTETKITSTNLDYVGFGIYFQQTVEVSMCGIVVRGNI